MFLFLAACWVNSPEKADVIDTSLPLNEIDQDNDGATADVDCDDSNPLTHPGAVERCDGFINDCNNSILPASEADQDNDGWVACALEVDPQDWGQGQIMGGMDCDDDNGDVNPGEAEVCDEIDNNCNDDVDEDVLIAFYADVDGDGFGTDTEMVEACEAPNGYLSNDTDCDDSDETVFPGADELCDGLINDCDSTVLPDEEADFDGDTFVACTIDANGWDGTDQVLDGDDCDDQNNLIHPGADEHCDGLINDCDSTDLPVEEADVDGDGYVVCDFYFNEWFGSQDVLGGLDCDDTKSTIHPDATELCDGLTNNCDSIALPDEEIDNDGDGRVECVIDPNGWFGATISGGSDCHDGDATIFFGAPELCDQQDNDCDSIIDEGLPQITYYADNDNDGYGDPAMTTADCGPPSGYVINNDDCDDLSASINPAAVEICDQIDNNCNSYLDEGLATLDYYVDNDNDGFGDENDVTPTPSCSPVNGEVTNNDDCDDNTSTISPNASEWCDTVDNDCDDLVDGDDVLDPNDPGAILYHYDYDSDGYGDPLNGDLFCQQPLGYVQNDDDCDDANYFVPSNDYDCDGTKTEFDCDDTNASDSDACFTISSSNVTFRMKKIPAGVDASGTFEITRDFYVMESEFTQEIKAALSGSTSNIQLPLTYITWGDAAGWANALSNDFGFDDCYAPDGTTVYPIYQSDIASCVGFRMPTEAEWEYAAKAGVNYDYWTLNGGGDFNGLDCNSPAPHALTDGSDPNDYANTCLNPNPGPTEVMQLEPNGYGLYDMNGNVWEWTSDVYNSSFPNTYTDPNYQGSGSSRSKRGGCYNSDLSLTTSTARNEANPSQSGAHIGVRYVISLP